MGLFSKKKDDTKPELPRFPEFPQFHAEQAAYQPEFSANPVVEVKPLPQAPSEEHAMPAIMNHDEDVTIPIRKPMARVESPAPPMAAPQTQYRSQQPEMSVDRPLFIRVDDYREAMGNVEALKRTLQETEELLEKLDSIRMAEEEELKHARSNVDAIKEQLLFIDKRLFEV